MKKKLIIYLSILIVTLTIGISIFFIYNPKERNRDIQLYVNSFDGKEKFVIYEGPNIPYYKNFDESLDGKTYFYFTNDSDFLVYHVFYNEHFKYYNDDNKNYMTRDYYEFKYNNYIYYLHKETNQKYPYMFVLEPGGLVFESVKENKKYVVMGPNSLYSCIFNFDEKGYANIEYDKLVEIRDYMDLFVWYISQYEGNEDKITIDPELLNVDLKVYDYDTKKEIDGFFIRLRADGKAILIEGE